MIKIKNLLLLALLPSLFISQYSFAGCSLYDCTTNTNITNPAGNTLSGTKVNHIVVGGCTLSAGTCTVTLAGASAYTSSSTYWCSGNDTSGSALAVSVQNQSGTSVQFFGTLTDAITFSCIGY